MPKLIKNAEIVPNKWTIISKEESLEEVLAHNEDALIIPVQLWLDNKTSLQESGNEIAVWLESDEPASLLENEVDSLNLIALNFPKFVDGRSYSTAAKLRQQYNYTGELRAIGEILRDQLTFLKRCGFDSFDLCDEVKDEDALSAFDDFKDNYQSTVENPVPLFKRR